MVETTFHREKTEHYQRVEASMVYAGQVPPGGYQSPRYLTEKERLLRANISFEECMEKINALGVQVEFMAPGDTDWLSLNAPTANMTYEHRFLAEDNWDFGAPMAPEDPEGPTRFEVFVDSAADLSVVNIGDLITAGVTDVGVLEEVDAANLRKFPGGKPYAVREDGKFLKPPDWVGPDIASVLVGQGFPE